MIVRLLEKEALLFQSSVAPNIKCDPWREKVIHWFFTVVSVLGRNQSAGARHPFNRATVHHTIALMDNYLASLSCERSAQFRRDRVAYQVLATSCLLLGMRSESSRLEGAQKEPSTEMKRSTKIRNMDQHACEPPNDEVLEIPHISSILRISAAPNSISEATILTMVQEITSSRVFSQANSVTALNFVEAFARNSTHTSSSSHRSITLDQSQARNACRLADAALFCSSCKPSVIACAAITAALLRADPDQDIGLIRQRVFHSVFGDHDDTLWKLVRDVEAWLLRVGIAHPRNDDNQVHPRTPPAMHVVPDEE